MRGGVEFGFLSTTTDRSVAMHYAASAAGVVLEMQMGMVDRGADISWLSQYPFEHGGCTYGSNPALVLLHHSSGC